MKYSTGFFLCILFVFSLLPVTSMSFAAQLAPNMHTDLTTSTPLMSPAVKPATAPASSGHSLEERLAQNADYILATKLMQSTIDLLETRITPEQHKRLSQWQQKWAHGEKDAEIAKLSKTMPLERAHIKATVERMRVLLRIAAVVPPTSIYTSKDASFTAIVQENNISVQGTARNAQGQTCAFYGKGRVNKGWMQMHNGTHADFYVLFTPKAAFITHVGDSASVGCPEVAFNGAYVKK